MSFSATHVVVLAAACLVALTVLAVTGHLPAEVVSSAAAAILAWLVPSPLTKKTLPE
jgi:hypothetical protein